jgi:hypothetical protein
MVSGNGNATGLGFYGAGHVPLLLLSSPAPFALLVPRTAARTSVSWKSIVTDPITAQPTLNTVRQQHGRASEQPEVEEVKLW